NGMCGYDTCQAGFGDCDGDKTNGCEAALDTVSNCGTCGKTCPAGGNGTAACTAGRCVLSCKAGFLDGNSDPGAGCETIVTTTNCGSCGNVCPPGGSCEGTQCTLTRWTDGTSQWPDDACNSNTSFGSCDSNAQNEADAWATWICQH